MTSKEALNNIRDYNTEVIHDVGSEYNENPLEEECNVIEKDLEVLDQLKKILSMNYLVRVYGYEMADRLQTYLKSNDAVKRWLDGKD